MIQPRVADFIEGLQPIAAEIGVEVARSLSVLFGGTRLYIPRRWRPDTDVNVLGEDVARKLCALFGPERIDIPKMPFTPQALKRFVDAARAAGHTNREIARELGMSWRTVTRLVSTTPLTGRRRRVLDDRQIDLIDFLDSTRR